MKLESHAVNLIPCARANTNSEKLSAKFIVRFSVCWWFRHCL